METTFRGRVEQRLKAVGIDSYEAAKRAGFERTYIEDIIRGKKMSVRSSALGVLAAVLQTSETWLLQGIGPEDVSKAPQLAEATPNRPPPARVSASMIMEVLIMIVDLDTGECRLQVAGNTTPGTIVDPALAQPGNAYAAAFVARRPLRVRAKRVSDQRGERLVIVDVAQDAEG